MNYDNYDQKHRNQNHNNNIMNIALNHISNYITFISELLKDLLKLDNDNSNIHKNKKLFNDKYSNTDLNVTLNVLNNIKNWIENYNKIYNLNNSMSIDFGEMSRNLNYPELQGAKANNNSNNFLPNMNNNFLNAMNPLYLSYNLQNPMMINNNIMNNNFPNAMIPDGNIMNNNSQNAMNPNNNTNMSNNYPYIMNMKNYVFSTSKEKHIEITFNIIENIIENKIESLYEDINLDQKQDNSFQGFGYEYIEPSDICSLNEKLIEKLTQFVYEDINSTYETKENELFGDFLYYIGGIARKSLEISNLFYYKEFKKMVRYPKFKCKKSRINLSILAKSQLNHEINKRIEIFSKQYIYEFLNEGEKEKEKKKFQNDPKARKFFEIFFYDLVKLYLLCTLSIPFVEIKFLDNKDNSFDSDKMCDLISKKNADKKKVNFCYLPLLWSNGKEISGSKFYVFTYIDGSYKREEENIDYKNIIQIPQLNN